MSEKPIKLIIRGVEVTCHDVDTAIQLINHATPGVHATPENGSTTGEVKRGPGRPPNTGHSPRVSKKENDLRDTLDFMRLVQSSPRDGASAESIVKKLDLKGARGIGAAIVKITRVLGEHELSSKRVFKMVGERTNRRWRAGPELTHAVDLLTSALPKE